MSHAKDEFIGRTSDPEGAPVVLLERVWRKVLGDHPELTHLRDSVLEAVEVPDHFEPDPVRPDRSRYFRRGAGPSRWLLVVVSYEQKPARIITAFGIRKDPGSWSK